ncbi:hypothetical protein J7K27_01210 [Candidatus Bathyarchaeota archaeon]|nr:hypothetical protein [Candidatus Bathyarchaeota archaeon]
MLVLNTKPTTKKLILIPIFLLLLSLFANLTPKTQAQQEITETYSPSSTTTIVSGWNLPERAYSSDNYRTSTSTDGAEQEYAGYEINIPSEATIQNVYVGVEGYTTASSTEALYVKIYDGSTWYTKTATDYSSETLQWLDFTSSTSWTPQKVNSIKTRIKYDYTGSGGGCYPNNTLILTYLNETHLILKSPSQITRKDLILTYNYTQGFAYTPVETVEIHNGTWEMLKITLETTFKLKGKIFEWHDFIYLTTNHPIFSPKLKQRIPAQNLKVGDQLLGLELGEFINVTITKIEQFTFNGTVYNIRFSSEYKNYYYFAISLEQWQISLLEAIFGKNWNILKKSDIFTLGAIGKLTYYVDWLPVKIVYTLPEAKSWHTVETWNFTLLTRTWHNVESWTFNIVTRAWHTVESWFFKIIGREWHNIESWQFSIKTRQWQTIEVWNFNLTVLKPIPPITPIPSKVISKTKPEYIATTYIVVGMILCLVYAYFRKTSKG